LICSAVAPGAIGVNPDGGVHGADRLGTERSTSSVEPQPRATASVLGGTDMTAIDREPTGPRLVTPLIPPPSRAGVDITVRPVDAAHGAIVTVEGPVDRADAAVLGQHLDAELDRGRHVLVVDLSGVPACDPAGVEVLAAARARARREDVTLHLVHLGAPAARRWLTTAGMS
jgi:anti-sigma B factor antagonist